ncbi:hypothetical protein DINM_006054 [Dirofilaria immitis]|nr:hypothetical protein [Dirofilaria immitis]
MAQTGRKNTQTYLEATKWRKLAGSQGPFITSILTHYCCHLDKMTLSFIHPFCRSRSLSAVVMLNIYEDGLPMVPHMSLLQFSICIASFIKRKRTAGVTPKDFSSVWSMSNVLGEWLCPRVYQNMSVPVSAIVHISVSSYFFLKMECGRSPKDPDRHHAGMMEVGTSLQQKCERICLLSRAPPTDTNLELNCLKDEK